MYELEEHLVKEFVSCLLSSSFAEWSNLKVATEFNYKRGRTDIIAINSKKQIIAFEAKLKKWREALHQAYRNTCFAHYSFIIVPEETANRAIQYVAEFSRRSVGICFISDNEIKIAYPAPYTKPIQKWLSNLATSTISDRGTSDKLQPANYDCSRDLQAKELDFCRRGGARSLQDNLSYYEQ